jgi:sulfur-oxidizing protein SoxY
LKNTGYDGATESSDILLKAPDIAENGAVVPITATSNIPGTTSIAIFVEKNPTPLIADFSFSNGAEAYISTRIKMAKTSVVRVSVKAGGKNYTTSREVKVTIGGCGG